MADSAARACGCGPGKLHHRFCPEWDREQAEMIRRLKRAEEGPPLSLIGLLRGYVTRHAQRCAPPSMLGRIIDATGRMPSDVPALCHALAARLIKRAQEQDREAHPGKPLPLEEILAARFYGRGRVSGFSYEQLAERTNGKWTSGELERRTEAALARMRRLLREAERGVVLDVKDMRDAS